MLFAYLGPGVGIGGLVVLLGIGVALLFLLYAFVILPFRRTRQKKRQNQVNG